MFRRGACRRSRSGRATDSGRSRTGFALYARRMLVSTMESLFLKVKVYFFPWTSKPTKISPFVSLFSCRSHLVCSLLNRFDPIWLDFSSSHFHPFSTLGIFFTRFLSLAGEANTATHGQQTAAKILISIIFISNYIIKGWTTGSIFARVKFERSKKRKILEILGNNPNLQVQMHNGD